MEMVSSNPSQATSFLFFSTKMITFVVCKIFELIWYSEFILAHSFSIQGDDAGSKSPDANDFDEEDGNGITIDAAKEPGVKFSSLVEDEK